MWSFGLLSSCPCGATARGFFPWGSTSRYSTVPCGPQATCCGVDTEQVLVWRGRSTGCESVSCLAWSALSCPRRRLGRLRRVLPGGCLATQAVEGFRYHTYRLRRSGAFALRRGSQCRSTGPPTPSGTASALPGCSHFSAGGFTSPVRTTSIPISRKQASRLLFVKEFTPFFLNPFPVFRPLAYTAYSSAPLRKPAK